jgi:hypothetical protein
VGAILSDMWGDPLPTNSKRANPREIFDIRVRMHLQRLEKTSESPDNILRAIDEVIDKYYGGQSPVDEPWFSE